MNEQDFPYHCAPLDIEALIQQLDALADPEKEAFPAFENVDWRVTASICALVIRYLRDDCQHTGA